MRDWDHIHLLPSDISNGIETTTHTNQSFDKSQYFSTCTLQYIIAVLTIIRDGGEGRGQIDKHKKIMETRTLYTKKSFSPTRDTATLTECVCVVYACVRWVCLCLRGPFWLDVRALTVSNYTAVQNCEDRRPMKAITRAITREVADGRSPTCFFKHVGKILLCRRISFLSSALRRVFLTLCSLCIHFIHGRKLNSRCKCTCLRI